MKSWEMDEKKELIRKALYELSVEACGGDEGLLIRLVNEHRPPEIYIPEVEKRAEQIRKRRVIER